MHATLKSRGWLKRVIEVPAGEGLVLVAYNGRALGTEKISVGNIKLVARSALWYVPRFELFYNKDKYVVQVRVGPCTAIQALTVERNDELVYSEGPPPYPVTRKTEALRVICCYLFIVVILLNYLLVAS